MKKEYRDLEMETVTFEAEDVITASGGDCPLVAVLPCDADGGMICECNDYFPGETPCDCLAPAYA